MPNIAPAGTNATRTIPRSYTLHKSDFGFTDTDGNAFLAVRITALATAGTLYYDANGALGGGRVAVTAGQTISAADILAGKLTYVAPAGVSGPNYANFTFQVQDNGGTAGGGVDIDQSPNMLTFNLVASGATPTTFGSLIDLTGLSAAAGFKIQGELAVDAAGRSVSSAGDVNGDGFADIIVGAPGNDGGGSNAGAAYVIFGKASGFGTLINLATLAAAEGFKIQGAAAGDYAGTGVSAAGDVNGDGFADVIVGAHYNDGGGANAGAGYVIFGKASGFATVNLATLAASDGFKIQGDLAGDDAGWSVSSAGDVNGDGLADVIVSAQHNDDGGTDAGAAYVIFGKTGGFGTLIDLTGLSSATGFKIQGDLGGDLAGFGIASAGDVNGDGFADIIVGAKDNDSGGSGAGAAYVIFGKAGGFGTLIDLTGLSATDGFKIQGDLATDYAGWSVSSAGDVNGDGFADIIVGANGNDSAGTNAGAAFVIFGKASGFGALIDLTDLSPANGFKIRGEALNDNAGVSVSSAGDVNGDGFADMLVGARNNDSGGTDAGAAYLIFGKSSGFGSVVDLVSLSATAGFKIQGDAAGDLAGYNISSAGDVNGDGFADIVVGALYNDSGGSNAGAAYVIFGHANIFAAPAGADRILTIPRSYVIHKADFGFSDADGNGFKSVVFTTLPTAGTLYYDSNGALAGGRTAVIAGQTVSASDIVAGKLTYVAPAGASGSNYAHFTFQVRDDGGTAAGSVDTDQSPNTLTFNLVASAATPASFGSLIDLTNLSATAGFKIQGDALGDNAGRSVSAAGDVNGDGFADVIVGALANGSGGADAGAAYVIFGKASGFGSLIDLSTLAASDGFKIQGAAGGDYAGTSVSAAGDINGDGFGDVVVGAVGNDSGGANAGAAYVIFGKASGFGSLINLGFPATIGFKIQGDLAGDDAGFSVSTAGDVNGDGFADIIVGAYGNDSSGSNAGAAYVIFGKPRGLAGLIDLTGLVATDGFKIQGDLAGDLAGFRASSGGDVNGDGFADIIVGAPSNDSGDSNAGAAYVIFGKASGFGSLIVLAALAASDGFKIQGDLADDAAGASVASAGDINGDGFADIVVGAFSNDSGGANAGAAYVIFGKSGGFGTLLDLAALTAAQGFKIQGELALDDAGFSVSSGGDVNGDGYADIIIGALANDGGGDAAGAAYVIFGKASGFGTMIDLTDLRAIDGFKIQGDLAGDRAGRSVSAAGDVNGDGFDDIIVGAYGNDSGGALAGAAYVIFGHANAFTPPAGADSSLTTSLHYVLHQADFGFSDPDGNRLGSVVVATLPGAGTLYYDSNGSLGGVRSAITAGQAVSAVDILAGKLVYVAPSGAAGGEDHFTFRVRDDSGAGGALDTDQSPNTLTFSLTASATISPTFGSLIDLTNLSADNGFKIQGDLAGDYAGISVSSAGDINGDGFADIIVGAYGNDSGGASAGAAYVIFGKASGFGSLIDLTGLPATAGFKIQGDADSDAAGATVSAAGDVNGDGFADIIIGGVGNDSGGDFAGAAYVIFGKASGFGALIDLTGLAATDGFKIQGDLAGDFAGNSVSAAGDVNGDGFDDIIIGANGNDSGGIKAGAAYLIFGRPSAFGGFGSLIDLTGLTAANGFKIQGDLAGDNAGLSVSSAGDVNGDGVADLLVGAYGNDSGGSYAGAAYVIFGKASGFGALIDLTTLAATDGFKIQGSAVGVRAGISVSSAGDINGDGFADVFVGESFESSVGNLNGGAYVVFGKASGFGSLVDLNGLAATAGFKIVGEAASDLAGAPVSAAGDVNGDGFADIIIGARGNDSGSANAGAAYVIFGKASGFGSVIDLAHLRMADGFKIQGDLSYDNAGISVSAAGDINGDGFADLLVGAKGNDSGGTDAGAAYVIYGRSNILSAPTGTDRILAVPRSYVLHKGDFGYSDADGSAFKSVIVATLPGAGTLYYDANGALGGGRTAVIAGQTISVADIVAGKLTFVAPANATVANYDHFTFQVRDDSGASGGLDTDQSPNLLTFSLVASAATPATFGSLIDFTGLSTSNGFKIQGDLAGDLAGWSVSSAGDINRDGLADIIIGAPSNDSGGGDAGAAYVIFGKASAFSSLIDLTSLSPSIGFKIQGDLSGDAAGISVSSAGDVNGDGIADLIVSAPFNGSGGAGAGAAYVIFGRDPLFSGFGSVIDLTSLFAFDGFKIQGDASRDYAGSSVSSAGDVNGDGFADIIVGAYRNGSGGINAGAAYVIFGKASGFGALVDLTGLAATDGFKIQGDQAGDKAGISVSSAGDVNGDGFADVIVGAYRNGGGGIDAGAAYVIFGKAGGFGALIDLTGLAATDGFKIQGDVAYDRAGRSVSSAGDVNGDGFADIIVGAYQYGATAAGAAYVIFGKASGFGSLVDLTSLASTAGFKILGEAGYDRAGFSVASAGDVNGDGFADIIVSGHRNDSGGTDAGAAYVVFGKASGFGSVVNLATLGAADGFKIQGDLAGDNAGNSVSSAGDINGDGFADLIVGGRYNGSGGVKAGAAYVIYGRANVAATAANDAASVAENATVTINVLANDIDPGHALAVTRIDGKTIAVGAPVTLVSGAIVSLNNDGTLTYNPNGQYNTLTSTSTGETGAVNTAKNVVFTYALAGGGIGTVTVTVNGNASVQDHLEGDGGNNIITGTGNGDYFDLSQGGNDVVSGLGGNDGFFFGAAFTAADRVDGGPGNGDQIGLQGDYTGGNALALASNTITNIEAIAVLPGFSYAIVTDDGNVAAGGVLKIQATQLAAGQSLIFNGSAEHDGSFTVYGGNGNDDMTGGDGNDGFYFGPGQFNASDLVNGGPGANDQLALDGDYTITLGGNVTNVEVLVLLHGPTGIPNHFNVTAGDAFVAAGKTMTVFGLQVETAITFNGSGEHDGAFRIYGGLAGDTLTGGDGNDWIFGGAGSDTMTGGAGADIFYYDDIRQSASNGFAGTGGLGGNAGRSDAHAPGTGFAAQAVDDFSTAVSEAAGGGFDRLIGFDDSVDKIDLPFAVTGLAAPASGALSSGSFDSNLSAAFAGLGNHQAGMFTATSGDMAGRTFLIVDADGHAGYQAGSDYVMEIVSPVTPIDNPALFI